MIIAKNNFFSLKTRNTEYQMQADKYGVLKHIWYGKKLKRICHICLNILM